MSCYALRETIANRSIVISSYNHEDFFKNQVALPGFMFSFFSLIFSANYFLKKKLIVLLTVGYILVDNEFVCVM